MQNYEAALRHLQKALALPHHMASSRRIVKDHAARLGSSGAYYRRMKEEVGLRNVPLSWPYGPPYRTLVTTSKRKLHPLAIAMGFFDQGYLAYGSALYWNRLSEQVPHQFYVASERKSPTRSGSDDELPEETVRDEFMKPARTTRKVAKYGEYQFALIERAPSGNLGVVGRVVRQGESSVPIRLTNLERTLLDIAVSPHYSGGIQAAISAYESARRRWNIGRLADYYRKLGFVYPYWQRIGLLLQLSGSAQTATAWREQFGIPRSTFYLDHEYRLDWQVEKTWNVACPPGFL